MLNQIWKQVGGVKATNEVLDWQQRLQRKGTSPMAFKDFFEVKAAYHRMLRQKEERTRQAQATAAARQGATLGAGPGGAATNATTTEYDGTTHHDRTTHHDGTTNVDGTTNLGRDEGGTGTELHRSIERAELKQTMERSTGVAAQAPGAAAVPAGSARKTSDKTADAPRR